MRLPWSGYILHRDSALIIFFRVQWSSWAHSFHLIALKILGGTGWLKSCLNGGFCWIRLVKNLISSWLRSLLITTEIEFAVSNIHRLLVKTWVWFRRIKWVVQRTTTWWSFLIYWYLLLRCVHRGSFWNIRWLFDIQVTFLGARDLLRLASTTSWSQIRQTASSWSLLSWRSLSCKVYLICSSWWLLFLRIKLYHLARRFWRLVRLRRWRHTVIACLTNILLLLGIWQLKWLIARLNVKVVDVIIIYYVRHVRPILAGVELVLRYSFVSLLLTHLAWRWCLESSLCNASRPVRHVTVVDLSFQLVRRGLFSLKL